MSRVCNVIVIVKPKGQPASIFCFQNLQNSISQLEKLEIGRNLVNFSNQDHLSPICALADFLSSRIFLSPTLVQQLQSEEEDFAIIHLIIV